jgi:hypothetical protein
MKATRAAKKSHQILKWTRMIQDLLCWRLADLDAEEVEAGMRGGDRLGLDTYEAVRAKKKASLLKYMRSLGSLIAPFNQDHVNEEDIDDEQVQEVQQNRDSRVRDKKEKLDRIVAGALKTPTKVIDLLTPDQQREKASAKKE